MYLLDTMVLSESGKRLPDPRVMAWLSTIARDRIFVSVISLGEMSAGLLSPNLDAAFAERLALWQAGVRASFEDQTLPITTAIASRWAELYVPLGRKDADLFIAATALEHDLTVVTRNIRHFAPTGVKLLNPYA